MRVFWRAVLGAFRRHLKRATAFLLALALLALASILGLLLRPLDPAPYLAVSPSGELLDHEGRLLYAFLNPEEQWCFPRELAAISPHVAAATIAAEDQRFGAHPGVDPLAVLRATLQNALGWEVRSGASTITMQVVKLAEPTPRTLFGKARQAVQALRLERAADKDAIIEAYLNKAPYGLNLVGVEAAARRYFGKPAAELSLDEAALLAGLPKSPTALAPLRHPGRAKARRDHVLARMQDDGSIDPGTHARAAAREVGAVWHDFPALAPHLAIRLRSQVQELGRMELTLDAKTQADTEARVARYLENFRGEITNAAVMVVDVAQAAVLVRVGGADFRAPSGGQFDVCAAPRSPGSALKPFAYALAMESQLLYPTEYLLDSILDYGTYAPGNFDGMHRGTVTAAEALRYSLNVPALAVLERIGAEAFRNQLAVLGIDSLHRDGAHYGVGLVLGNAEVRLEDLVEAYTVLANGGMHRTLRLLQGAPDPLRTRAMSEGTATALFAMLEQPLPREDARGYVQARGTASPVAWKTGTSTGLHDAWAVVYNAHYVVGVWLGNSDGRASERLVGATAALPLAGALFRSLPTKPGSSRPGRPDDLKEVRICADSGLPVSVWCRNTDTTQLPRDQYLHRRCAVHVEGEGGEVAERWPASARGWNLARTQAAPRPERALVSVVGAERRPSVALRIAVPADGAEYLLTGQPQGDRIALRAAGGAQGTLHWYLNDRYLGASGGEVPLLLPLTPGEHRISCMADTGETDDVAISVRQPENVSRLRTPG